jgi:hypothetical protein
MNLVLFIVGFTLLTLYGLTVSGHFPASARSNELQTPVATFVIALTLLMSGLAAMILIGVAVIALPWTTIIIAGGGAVLAGPVLLRVFPDDFVDGLGGMVSFALATIVIAIVLWATH